MNGELEGHLQNIEDFIQIDDKIVTYKWISKVLKVHTNTAKQLLFAFSKKPEVSDKLLVTYIVAGEQHDGKGLNFQLVQEKDLEAAKKLFHKITSTHVYSIQRGASISGSEIYNADSSYKMTPEDLKFSSIQISGEIDRREMKVVIPATSLEKAPVSSKTAPLKETKPISQNTKQASNKGDEPLKTKNQEVNVKEKEIKDQALKKASPKKNEKKTSVKGGNIGALFKKQADKQSSVKAEVKKVNEEKEAEEVVEASNKTTSPEVKTPNAKKSAGKKKRKKPKDSKDSAAKRRKRIQVASDSESSDQESDGNERFPSPEPEPETPMVIESDDEDIIPSTPLEKGRKRVKKMVDRTYEDEEGYIITKKEYVVESCSDNESQDPPSKKAEIENISESKTNGTHEGEKTQKKEVPQKSQKTKQDAPSKGSSKPGKAASKAKTNGSSSPRKQSSIMSFFKKQ